MGSLEYHALSQQNKLFSSLNNNNILWIIVSTLVIFSTNFFIYTKQGHNHI